MASARQRFLAAEDEDELMALQEQMQRSQTTPSATVKRIQRKTSEETSQVEKEPVHNCSAPHCPHDHSHSNSHSQGAAVSTPSVDDLMASMQTAMKGIVGEVQERTVIVKDPPSPPPLVPSTIGNSTTSHAAFPAAVHRKQSKFSLARQGKEAHSSVKRVSYGPTATTTAAPPPAMPALNTTNLSEAESIAAETTAVINAMSPEQLEAAREEVLSRIPPSAAEFLRKRGAQKAAAAAAAVAASKMEATEVEQFQEQMESSSLAISSGSNKTASAPRNTNLSTAAATLSTSFQPELSMAPSPTTTSFLSSTPTFSITPSRLRFNITGNVVSLKPLQLITNTALAPIEVVSRDPLRQSEKIISAGPSTASAPDAAAEGYTIEEACVLARSTVVQQRVFALRLLRAVLILAKPTNSLFSPAGESGGGGDSGGGISNRELIGLENIINSNEKENQQPLPRIYWIDIWRHALHDAKVPLVLRVAFDDQNNAVVTAATEALAALLSPGTIERQYYNLGDANPLVSWPMVPLRHMQRPNASGSHWIAAPVDLKARRERRAAARAARVAAAAAAGIPISLEEEDEEEESDDIDEKELARVDPLAGLLNMELIERIGYVLGTLRPPGATSPLLTILENICYAGQDAAKKVAETPGVLDAVVKVLFSEEKDNEKEKLVETGGGGRSNSVLRLQGMRVLRLLCQISPLSARAVAIYPGLLASTVLPIIFKQQQTQQISSISRQILLEALQIWRCLTLYGFHIGISVDDAYPALCLLLNPSVEDSVGQWEVSREVYYALAQVVAKEVESSSTVAEEEENVDSLLWISKKCSSSIAQQTLDWVCSLPLVEDFLCADTTAGERSEDNKNAAVVVVSAVSAALYFLGTHYSRKSERPSVGHDSGTGAAEDYERKKEAALTLLTEAGILSSEKLPFFVSSTLTTCLEGPISITAQPMLTAYASLALTLARLEAVLSTGVANGKSDRVAAVALGPFTSPATIRRLYELFKPIDSTLLQPWDMPVMQSCLELSRCVAAASAGGLDKKKDGNDPMTSTRTTDAALAALQALPPGTEDTALQLMAHCFSSNQLQHTINLAFNYLENNKDSLSPLAGAEAEAAGCSPDAELLPSKPSVEIVGKVLLAGYAATHLGFVQEEQEEKEGKEEEKKESEAGVSVSPAAALAGLSYSQALLRPEIGSTLPLHRLWPLQHSPTPPPGSNVSAPASLATAYALLWSFRMTLFFSEPEKENLAAGGTEETSENKVASASSDSAGEILKENIKAAVMLVFDREEQGVEFEEQSQRQGEQEDFEIEVWREPLVRWFFAAHVKHTLPLLLTNTTTTSTSLSSTPSPSIKFTIPEAKRLVDGFSSSSFGDALFGIAVALLFHSAFSPVEVQLDALMSLVDGKSLHLLPCVDICPGDRFRYLGSPARSFSSSSFAAAEGVDSSDAQKEERANKVALDTYLQILTTPEALKCVETDSIGLSVVLHRLAKSIFRFVVEEDSEEESVDEKQENGSDNFRELEKSRCSALLCSAIRRLRGKAQERGLQVLSMLLRWSCKEGRASDVISASRMEFIQQACGKNDTGELLHTVMAALHS
ncbi:hypothetical protein NADE_007292 [Nannochloris sp. 'desiccata']|nr:hypothetical protein NADE_007292 [Chlorella desiccata (nom. nud.)]